MKISETERAALRVVMDLGEMYGYGNLISHLRTAWARKLKSQGLPVEGAHGGGIMNFQMQEDLLERGEWDETGNRYRDNTAPDRYIFE